MYTRTRPDESGERGEMGIVGAGVRVCVCVLCMHSKELINVDSCRRQTQSERELLLLRLWKCETNCNCAHISKIAGAIRMDADAHR